MPRSIHIVPSVMMNGCTFKPTTISPLTMPATRPTASATPRTGGECGRSDPSARSREATIAEDDAGQCVDRSNGQIDAAGDDDDRRADRHHGKEARVGRRLNQGVRVEKVVDLDAAARVDVRSGEHGQDRAEQQDDQHESELGRSHRPS